MHLGESELHDSILSRRVGKIRNMKQLTPRVGFVSLGCPKALVDSERILTQLRAGGYEVVPSYDEADLVVVNAGRGLNGSVITSDTAAWEEMVRTNVLGAARLDGTRLIDNREIPPVDGQADSPPKT
jgi:NAD(P)-dependent dehydrogenase (short-subunit alcohol dehydrogenase family)